jgi:hypothetical protein
LFWVAAMAARLADCGAVGQDLITDGIDAECPEQRRPWHAVPLADDQYLAGELAGARELVSLGPAQAERPGRSNQVDGHGQAEQLSGGHGTDHRALLARYR